MMNYMNLYENYMKIIGPVGNFMFFIQAYKIFDEKSAEAISLGAFSLSLIGLASWLLYGIFIRNFPLVIANFVGVIGAILVLAGTLIYG